MVTKADELEASDESDEPVDDAPVDDAPVDDAPVDEAPVEDEPVDEAPLPPKPEDEEPVDDDPVDDEPAEEESTGIGRRVPAPADGVTDGVVDGGDRPADGCGQGGLVHGLLIGGDGVLVLRAPGPGPGRRWRAPRRRRRRWRRCSSAGPTIVALSLATVCWSVVIVCWPTTHELAAVVAVSDTPASPRPPARTDRWCRDSGRSRWRSTVAPVAVSVGVVGAEGRRGAVLEVVAGAAGAWFR